MHSNKWAYLWLRHCVVYGISLDQHIVVQCTIYICHTSAVVTDWIEDSPFLTILCLKTTKLEPVICCEWPCLSLSMSNFQCYWSCVYYSGPKRCHLCVCRWPESVRCQAISRHSVDCWLHRYDFPWLTIILYNLYWLDHVIQNGQFGKIRALIIT